MFPESTNNNLPPTPAYRRGLHIIEYDRILIVIEYDTILTVVYESIPS